MRVAQGWAGGGYGSIAIPRIGHEVIVSFLEGDPDQPLVTGRTYHAVNTAPYPLPSTRRARSFAPRATRPTASTNCVFPEDEAGEEDIWLHAQKDLELLTLNDRTEEIRRDSHLKSSRNRLTEIHNDDHLTVHSNRHTQIKGAQYFSIEGSLHVNTGQAWLSESGRELHIKSGQKAVLEASDEITLKAGSSFIKLDASGVTIVGPEVRVNSGGSPGNGSGQQSKAPMSPGETTPEVSDDATLEPHQSPLLEDAVVASVGWVANQALNENEEPETSFKGNEEIEEEATLDAALHEKAQRWRCRQGQITAAREQASALPERNDQRSSLLASAARFERNNLAVEHARLAQHIYDPSQPPPVGWEDVSNNVQVLKRADISSL